MASPPPLSSLSPSRPEPKAEPKAPNLKQGIYPAPLIIPPLSGNHQQSFILLHGRGSNAHRFGPTLLQTPPFFTDSIHDMGDGTKQEEREEKTLRECFPHARFIFPTAAPGRAKMYNRTKIFQWMDHSSLDRPSHEQELQIPRGLKDSITHVHTLLRKEIDAVGSENVVLGGLSQGCACGLISLLTFEHGLAGFWGACGWLPSAELMMMNSVGEDGEGADEEDDVFERSDDDDDDDDDDGHHCSEEQRERRMVAGLYDILDRDLSSSSSTTTTTTTTTVPVLSTPIFLGHGTLDEKVPLERGKMAAETLAMMNQKQVTWKEYDGLGHWYSSVMLGDVVSFIKENTSWS